MSNSQKIGLFVAESIELLEKKYGDDIEIGEMAIVLEVREHREDGAYTGVEYRCSNPKGYIQRGLLEEALDGCRFGHLNGEDSDE